MYSIWVARHDIASEWDGGGTCMESVDTLREAIAACVEYQKNGDAAWYVYNG